MRSQRSPSFQQGKEHVIANKIFVGNLNFETTRDELVSLFSEAGDIIEVLIPNDRATGRPRGFAFVEFATPEAVTQAIEKFDGHELGGRTLRINEARERAPGGFSRGGPRDFSFEGGGFGGRPARPTKAKGSRRNIRKRKRSL